MEIVGTSSALGAGESNTEAIVALLGEGTYAARIAYELQIGGHDDWFLPSAEELAALYEFMEGRGRSVFGQYWSSSAEPGNRVVAIDSAGTMSSRSRFARQRVRAIRRF